MARKNTINNNRDRYAGHVQEDYIEGRTYDYGDIVLNQGVLFSARKRTNELAAIQPIGAELFDVPRDIAWQTLNGAEQITNGHRYTFSKTGIVKILEVYTTTVNVDTPYQIITVDRTNPDLPQFSQSVPFEGVSTNWVTIAVGSKFVAAGSVFDVYLVSLNSSTSSEWSYPYIYQGQRSSELPPQRFYNRTGNRATLRINDFDRDNIDRSADLANALSGTVFTITKDSSPTQDYEQYTSLVDPQDNGSAFTYSVGNFTGAGNLNDNDEVTIKAQTPTAPSTDYVVNVDWWNTPANKPEFATVQGIEGFEGIFNNNAYGIRITWQEALFPNDWKPLAASDDLSSINSALNDLNANSTGVTRKLAKEDIRDTVYPNPTNDNQYFNLRLNVIESYHEDVGLWLNPHLIVVSNSNLLEEGRIAYVDGSEIVSSVEYPLVEYPTNANERSEARGVIIETNATTGLATLAVSGQYFVEIGETISINEYVRAKTNGANADEGYAQGQSGISNGQIGWAIQNSGATTGKTDFVLINIHPEWR